jgi:SAM-dependent methyltransferase
MRQSQPTIDTLNAQFWDEACGTEFAHIIGATGRDRASIRAFDAAFFTTYPFLDKFIEFDRWRGKDVLEVGLGYGSVSHRLSEGGARFVGLDIARGPVDWVNSRLRLFGLPGAARQGSILAAPFRDGSFDAVVALGCYHHTGDIDRALAETARILRPNGRAVIMVYNATSYICWLLDPLRTLRCIFVDRPVALASERERLVFDRNLDGKAPPETMVLRKPTFKRILRRYFSSVTVERTNIIAHRPFHFVPRTWLNAIFGGLLGLNLYATAVKKTDQAS